jgi:hypothetical protein
MVIATKHKEGIVCHWDRDVNRKLDEDGDFVVIKTQIDGINLTKDYGWEGLKHVCEYGHPKGEALIIWRDGFVGVIEIDNICCLPYTREHGVISGHKETKNE